MDFSVLLTSIKCIIGASIFFVWVIRYDNIAQKFQQYGYPAWLRDFVSILKFTCFLFLLSSHPLLVITGSAGIALLMSAAVFTHFRVKNAIFKILPSFTLMCLSLSGLFLFLNQ